MKALMLEAHRAWIRSRAYYNTPFRVYWNNYLITHHLH